MPLDNPVTVNTIPVKDEGAVLTNRVASINFAGAGVTAATVGDDVTVTIPGGGGGGDMFKADNLSGLANYTTARSNLGLGTAAVANLGTGGSDAAVGNHNHTGTYEPANANIQSHISSTSNPHSTTAGQVGAAAATHASQHTNGTDDIATFGTSSKGLVPASGGGTTNFLRADGSFAAPPAGGIAAADVFPAGNCVYVEANSTELAKLVAQGCLAYGNIQAALTSWRPSGPNNDAYVRYGAPTATNPAVILVGVGVFGITTEMTLDIPYCTMQGVNSDVSIIRATASVNRMIYLSSATFNLRNLTVDGSTFNQNQVVRFNGITHTGTFENCVFSNGSANPTAVFQTVSASANGTYKGCSLISTGAASPTWIFHEATGSGTFRDCVFTTANGGFSEFNNFSPTFTFIDCRFTGSASGIFTAGSGTDGCKYIDCEFFNTLGKGFDYSGGGTLSAYFGDCSFLTLNTCIDKPGAACVIEDSYLKCTGTNQTAVANIQAGAAIRRNTVIGTGSGVALSASGAISTEFSHNLLRRPGSGAAGSSVVNITTLALDFATGSADGKNCEIV